MNYTDKIFKPQLTMKKQCKKFSARFKEKWRKSEQSRRL